MTMYLKKLDGPRSVTMADGRISGDSLSDALAPGRNEAAE